MKETKDPKAPKLRLLRIFTKHKKSSFIKNILVVMTGSALAQVIGFSLAPIVSRLFSPSEFGIFGSFSAISSIIAAGATLEFSQAIMLPKEKETAINLLVLSFLCTGAISLLLLGFCMITPATVNGVMKTTSVWPLVLLVVAIIVSGTNQSCQAWSVRVKAFKQTSASQVIRSLASNASKIGFGFLGGGAIGLIISNILSDILSGIILFRVLLSDLKAFRDRIRWGTMRRLAKEYRDFPIYAASQNVINSLSGGLPVLLLTQYYGIEAAGAYAFGVSVLQVPMGFILTALRQVLFQKACETENQGGRLSALYLKTTLGLLAMVLLPSLILIIWAPQLFSWVFGPQWRLAGEFARSLVIWLAVVFCNLPAVLFARIIRIQRFVFFYDLVLLAARSLSLFLGGMFLSASQTVLVFALVGAGMNVFLIFRVGYSMIRKENQSGLNDSKNILKSN